MNESVTGLVLAGGESRRFGRDKARHPVDGRPMIRHVYEVVTRVADPVMISLRAETPSPLPASVPVVTDAWPGKGPLAGLHAGLLAMDTSWLLVVACDMPFITVEALGDLLQRRPVAGGAVVAQSSDGRQHPLCACYHAHVLPTIEASLRANRLALHRLLDAIDPVATVPLPEQVLRNINRPSDLPVAVHDTSSQLGDV